MNLTVEESGIARCGWPKARATLDIGTNWDQVTDGLQFRIVGPLVRPIVDLEHFKSAISNEEHHTAAVLNAF